MAMKGGTATRWNKGRDLSAEGGFECAVGAQALDRALWPYNYLETLTKPYVGIRTASESEAFLSRGNANGETVS